MERLHWEKNAEKIREASLERHAQLHRLFVEDRLGFERERKRMIDEFLNSVKNPEKRSRLEKLQESWDKRMKHAGSAHNRFVLAQTFFWDHFNEIWQPALEELSAHFRREMEEGGDSKPG